MSKQDQSVPLPIAPQNDDSPLAGYALKMLRLRPTTSPVDDVLREQEALAAREGIPIIGPLEGAILQTLVRLRHPTARQVLDIGTAIGYSALWLARALPAGGRLLSIDMDPQRTELARDFVQQAGFQDRIEIVTGNVLDTLPTLDMQFDVIFQDVIKHVYFGTASTLAVQLLDLCLERLAPNGMLLGDNAFCLGEVLHNPADHLPKQVAGIVAYNQRVATHPQLESVILPVRDGLWISAKA